MMKYPEDSIQYYCDSWWEPDTNKEPQKGSLIFAYVPHVDQIPNTLVPIGRESPTSHDKALFEIGPLGFKDRNKRPALPVAALPNADDERWSVYRAKMRPMLVIAQGCKIPDEYRRNKPKHQTSLTLTAAPYYGIRHKSDNSAGFRTGFHLEFIKRIKKGAYPHYIWDHLPHPNGEESLLRLDHLQPIGSHYQTIMQAGYRLTKEAMDILDEWIRWYLYDVIDQGGTLYDLKIGLEELFKTEIET